uniref:Uncharacterized protein n=1 Tax=Anguilla anguilla TaxID=7936 RepID=A0A0E9W4C1_ANGAN
MDYLAKCLDCKNGFPSVTSNRGRYFVLQALHD